MYEQIAQQIVNSSENLHRKTSLQLQKKDKTEEWVII